MEKGAGYSRLLEAFLDGHYHEERMDGAFCSQGKEGLLPSHSIVQTDVVQKDGNYVVYLMHINVEDPAQFVRLPARVCQDQRTAEIIASYKCKLCACDFCVPLTTGIEDFGFSEN